jgi:uncharacterized membrane protein
MEMLQLGLSLNYCLVIAGLGVSIFGFLTQKDEMEHLWHAVSAFSLLGAFLIGTPAWALCLHDAIQASVTSLFASNIDSSSIIGAVLKEMLGLMSCALTGLFLILFCMGPPAIATYAAVSRIARDSGQRRT